ncbi:MAG: SUMF1/EgtB/PvdO family nonheme iron enzyme [bacterium]|nr:SUMF1/EgtB/PvdO family nonheme iron enzyme [bacterium]
MTVAKVAQGIPPCLAWLLLLLPGTAPAERPCIKSITAGPKIAWDSQAGFEYRVSWSWWPSGPWEPLGDYLRGTGAEMSVYDDAGEAVLKLYRLEIRELVPAGMARIPGGAYEMGDHFGLDPLYSVPVHTVRVDTFFMDATELTNAHFCAFLNAAWQAGEIVSGEEAPFGDLALCSAEDPLRVCVWLRTSSIPGCDIFYDEFSDSLEVVFDRDLHPVVRVAWWGAAAYSNWRSEKEGLTPCYDLDTLECNFGADGYRLPTEAEWEYAARGGLQCAVYPWGDEIDGSKANYADSGDPHDNDGYIAIGAPTTPVGSYPPNGYGLYDMAGNAMELCNDYFYCYYYRYCVENGITDNPTGPPPSHESGHVWRGGSCYSTPLDLSCGLRRPSPADPFGFRCVRRPRSP